MMGGREKALEDEVMRHPTRFWLSGLSLAAAVLLAPTLVPAQTPEPAADNPAINGTPAPGTTQSQMASPSSEVQIPKGSNPDSGSGNMAAGSGATPPAQASGQASGNSAAIALPQTASNPDDSGTSGAMGTNTNGSKSPDDTMPQGKYASPPTSSSQQ
jgi:hypothetical protein